MNISNIRICKRTFEGETDATKNDNPLGRVVTRRKAKLLRNGFEQRPRRILHFWHSA